MKLKKLYENFDQINSKIYYRIYNVNTGKEAYFEDHLDILRTLQASKKGNYGSVTTYLNVGKKGTTRWNSNMPFENILWMNDGSSIRIHVEDYDWLFGPPDTNDAEFGYGILPDPSDLQKFIGPDTKTFKIDQNLSIDNMQYDTETLEYDVDIPEYRPHRKED